MPAQVDQEDPVVLRVGERAVGGGAVECREEVEAMADVADDEERRRRGKGAGVVSRVAGLGRGTPRRSQRSSRNASLFARSAAPEADHFAVNVPVSMREWYSVPRGDVTKTVPAYSSTTSTLRCFARSAMSFSWRGRGTSS